jgi:hypothetical protein
MKRYLRRAGVKLARAAPTGYSVAMPKPAAPAAKMDVDSLLKDVQLIGGRCRQGIDAMLREQAEVRRTAEQRVVTIAEQVERLNELYHAATGRYYVSSRRDKAEPEAEAKRGRRSGGDLKALAEEVADFLKVKGREGARAAEIRERFGKLPPGVKPFVEKHTDYKIKTEGAKAGTVYFIG